MKTIEINYPWGFPLISPLKIKIGRLWCGSMYFIFKCPSWRRVSINKILEPGLVVHTYNGSILETEAGGALVWAMQWDTVLEDKRQKLFLLGGMAHSCKSIRGRWWQECKIMFNYIESLRPPWATWDPVSKNKTRGCNLAQWVQYLPNMHRSPGYNA